MPSRITDSSEASEFHWPANQTDPLVGGRDVRPAERQQHDGGHQRRGDGRHTEANEPGQNLRDKTCAEGRSKFRSNERVST